MSASGRERVAAAQRKRWAAEESGAGKERGHARCPEEAEAQRCWPQGDHRGNAQEVGGLSKGWREEGRSRKRVVILGRPQLLMPQNGPNCI